MLFLVAAVVFYIIGMLLVKKENYDVVSCAREEYVYVNSDGEEQEGESLLNISGIGRVLTYRDVYYASVSMFIIAMVIGGILLGDGFKTKSDESLPHIIFANCVLGMLLIWLTSKETVLSTILFWLGIVSAYFAAEKNRNKL